VINDLCRSLNAAGCLDTELTGGIVWGIDSDPNAKVTLFLFDERSGPHAVAKVGRGPSGEAAVRAEHAALTRLHETSVGPLLDAPAPLMLERVRGRLVLVTSALPGAPMSVDYYSRGHVQDRSAVTADLTRAGRWLTRLRTATSAGTVELTPTSFVELVEATISRYRALIGCGEWEDQLFTGLVRDSNRFAGVVLPLSFVHGDFAIGNILTDRGAVSGVVDWELARDRDLPIYDVLKFVTSYSGYLDRAAGDGHGGVAGHPDWVRWRGRLGADEWSNAVGMIYALYGEGWYPDAVRRYLDEQAASLGVPREVIDLFLPVFLAEQATALEHPTFRAGYRSLLHLVARRRGHREPLVPVAGA
jgi:hypothetical protein